ncbi:hypothetical protein T492DRAFT_987896 [Pavlovales sp. CCMP2436]|nr:hypothetical protein T492DRAFT_987896 [Pavlovales sp. CCMP2436]
MCHEGEAELARGRHALVELRQRARDKRASAGRVGEGGPAPPQRLGRVRMARREDGDRQHHQEREREHAAAHPVRAAAAARKQKLKLPPRRPSAAWACARTGFRGVSCGFGNGWALHRLATPVLEVLAHSPRVPSNAPVRGKDGRVARWRARRLLQVRLTQRVRLRTQIQIVGALASTVGCIL